MLLEYNLFSFIKLISEKLDIVYKDTFLCNQYAWWLLQALCNKTRTQLIAQETLMLSPAQQETLNQWLDDLVLHKKPLQYILGSVPFADLEILVEPPTLIPRPETEEWCLKVIEYLQLLDNKKIKILDIATGSGCIALTLAAALPQAEIIGTDISNKALALAKKNREHNTIHNVSFIHSDLFEALPIGSSFDMIVSNPPYISYDQYSLLDEAVTKWEDHSALFADDNGLAIIKKIIALAPSFIHTNNEMQEKNIPQIGIEIGHEQAKFVHQLMEQAGYNNVLVHKDLENKDRFVTARADNIV